MTVEKLTYPEAVSGWAQHLRSGGTTPWSVWLEREPEAGQPLDPLPDAPHLELVRRLTLAAGGPVDGLPDRVLAIPSPGRGRVDVPLHWATGPQRFGSPAVDPAVLPAEDLVRLATGVLVHLLPGLPSPAEIPPDGRLPWPWRRRFRLHGPPGTAAAVRSVLRDQGLVETGWRAPQVVLALPIEVMMAEQWTAAVRQGGILRWSTFWRRAVREDALPEPLDVLALARRLAAGRDPVHVVVGREPQQVLETAVALLDARPAVAGTTADPTGTDLLRRVNRLATLVHGADRAPALVAGLVALLDDLLEELLEELPDRPGRRPVPMPSVPPPALAWATRQAARTAEALQQAGYPVHGDPADLTLSGPVATAPLDPDHTLDLALAACLRSWRVQRGQP